MEKNVGVVPETGETQVPDIARLSRTQRVLLLWPNEAGKDILVMLLSSADYNIRSVRTEAEALDYLYRERFLAVVFDSAAFSGEELKRVAELRRIPIIKISTPRESRGKTSLNETSVKQILTSLFTVARPSWIRR